MWVVKRNSYELMFYAGSEPMKVEGVSRASHPNDANLRLNTDDNEVVRRLLQAGVPMFPKKEQARDFAVGASIKSFSYLKLNPSEIKL